MLGESLGIASFFADERTLAADIVNEFTRGKDSRGKYMDRVAETTQYLYATSTDETSNVSNAHNHSTHIPKLTQIYDNLKANYELGLFGRARWFQFIGDNQDDLSQDKRVVVESYLRTKHRQSNFVSEIKKCLDDWIRTGNCFAEVFYDIETHVNPTTGAIQGGYKGPRVRRISPNDVTMNPLAPDAFHAAKVVRSLHTIGSLMREVEDNPAMGYKEEILNEALQVRHSLRSYSIQDIHKEIQFKFDGFGTMAEYLKSGFIEILDFYGDIYDHDNDKLLKNHVVSIVDRRLVLRAEPLNTFTGKPYIYHAGWRSRPDNLWAMGPLENLIGMQYMVNHLTNARADAFDQMLLPDKVFQGDVERVFKDDGSIEYRAPEAGNVRNLAPDTTVLNADLQISRIEQDMEQFAGMPEAAMGIKPPGEQTKFQVQSLQTAIGNLFQQKLEEFEINFLEPILNAELEVAISGLNTTDTIQVLDDETGVLVIQTITPEELHASGNINAVGARHFSRQAKLTQELTTFLGLLAQDPEVRDHFPSTTIGRLYEQLLQFDEFDLYEENGRISERADKAALQAVAQERVQNEQAIPTDELIEGDLASVGQ